MSNPKDDGPPPSFASPPCFMHELDPDYLGYVHPQDIRQKVDVRRWRGAARDKLIADRLTMTAQHQEDVSLKIASTLNQVIGNPTGLTISAFRPMHGEPDLRPWMDDIADRGGRCALPVVVEKDRPLSFRGWSPGQPLTHDIMNIPIPKLGQDVQPDIVIAPVVGFDAQCFRLGYGGGYFDRTLAVLSPKPRIIGIGYACAQIPTIYPQPHDFPMDMIITEAGVSRP